MSALSTGKRGTIQFFKGDEGGTPIGGHTVFDFSGAQQSIGMVQTWNQCEQMLLTSMDKASSVLLMDTETGSTMSELALRRQQKNWNLSIDSITPMQKFEQYKQAQEYNLFGLGDGGKTVFALTHDSRAGENVEEHVIRADACRKYKSYTFSCHAQTKGGYLALGRTDGGVALYDAIMKSENASCVLDGMPGPVSSIDVAADGSMAVWTTPEFVFFTCLTSAHWEKGHRPGKPAILRLDVRDADMEAALGANGNGQASGADDDDEAVAHWMPVRFDAATARDDVGVHEREIITYAGATQFRWNVRQAKAAWQLLDDAKKQSADAGAAGGGVAAPEPLYATATAIGGPVFRHVTVKEDMDVVALEGEIVKSLHF